MTFKNKQGEVHWYVIGIVLAIIVLLITLFGPVRKLLGAQDDISDTTKNTCVTIADGECLAKCEAPKRISFAGLCPKENGERKTCCVDSTST